MSDTIEEVLQRIDAKQSRIEAMLAQLLAALIEEEEPQPQTTLDGDEAGVERDQGQDLG